MLKQIYEQFKKHDLERDYKKLQDLKSSDIHIVPHMSSSWFEYIF